MVRDDRELLQRFKDGEGEASERVLEVARRAISQFPGLRHESSDLAQEAVRRTFVTVRKPDFELESTFSGLAYRIAWCVCANEWRRQRQQVELDANLPAPQGEDDVRAVERRILCEWLLQHLGPVDRRILSMSIFELRTSQEIGDDLGMRAGTVRARKRAALARLQKLLKACRTTA